MESFPPDMTATAQRTIAMARATATVRETTRQEREVLECRAKIHRKIEEAASTGKPVVDVTCESALVLRELFATFEGRIYREHEVHPGDEYGCPSTYAWRLVHGPEVRARHFRLELVPGTMAADEERLYQAELRNIEWMLSLADRRETRFHFPCRLSPDSQFKLINWLYSKCAGRIYYFSGWKRVWYSREPKRLWTLLKPGMSLPAKAYLKILI